MRRAWSLLLAVLVAACNAGITGATYPPVGVTPPPAGNATLATEATIEAALAKVGLQAAVATRPDRPPEGALLAAAPRTVLQVALPKDPDHGYIVVYALADAAAALSAARDEAAYIATGPGKVLFPNDAHFVIRVVDATVVFFTWSPASALDPRAADIEAALSSVGDGVAVPA
jgi:hypothetical protein